MASEASAATLTDRFFKKCFAMRKEMSMKNVEIMIPFVRTLDMARAMGDLLNDERMKIQMAHLCFLVCNAADCICYSDAAFEPGLLTVSGCAYTCHFSIIWILRTVVCLLC